MNGNEFITLTAKQIKASYDIRVKADAITCYWTVNDKTFVYVGGTCIIVKETTEEIDKMLGLK